MQHPATKTPSATGVLKAIPVSGEGRSTRERIATPFMKDRENTWYALDATCGHSGTISAFPTLRYCAFFFFL